MCRPVRCKTCGKTTWAGCGSHIAAVKASVPADQWCAGHAAPQVSSQSPSQCPSQSPSQSPSPGGFFARLLGR